MATASYVLVLVLTCVFSRIEHAMVLNLGALGLALVACGSGAARLCNALRKTGANNANIADTVFNVSRSMGTCFCEYSRSYCVQYMAHPEKERAHTTRYRYILCFCGCYVLVP